MMGPFRLSAMCATLVAAACLPAGPLAAQPGVTPSDKAPCVTTPARWMQRAVDTWAMVSRDAFGLPADSLPWIVLFDARCAWHLAPRREAAPDARDVTREMALRFGGAPVVVQAVVHGDTLRLPSGQTVRAQPTAFASLYRGDSASFFVMALPERWDRSAAEAADPAREEFFLGVLAHEMTHTVQLAGINRRVQEIGRRWALPERLNDDVVQQTFDSVPAFRALVERERDLLAAAALATDDGTRRRLTSEALGLAAGRRGQYFVGPRAVYAPLEDVFLLMEGIGSWAAFRVSLAHAEPGTPTATVVARLQKGRYWSQGIGLSMILVLDALLPDWRARLFAEQPPSIYALLTEAVARR